MCSKFAKAVLGLFDEAAVELKPIKVEFKPVEQLIVGALPKVELTTEQLVGQR
jgi:hypothetical protein